MKSFATISTAALLLLHAMLGCCRHGCGDEVKNARADFATPAVAACCQHSHQCCDDEEGSLERTPAELPCKCKLECKALCIYLPPQLVVVDAGNLRLSIDALPTNDSSIAASILAISRSWNSRSLRFHASLDPPLRRHLLYQVILA